MTDTVRGFMAVTTASTTAARTGISTATIGALRRSRAMRASL